MSHRDSKGGVQMSDQDEVRAIWPGSPAALVDTRLCPSCFEILTSITCSHCGLVLADPRAARLLERGDRMVDLEAERQKLIDEIRRAHSPAKTEPEPSAEAWWEGEAAASSMA